MKVPKIGSPNTSFVQAMLPVTPVRDTQLLPAPYHTRAVAPAGSAHVPPSVAQATAVAGGTPAGGTDTVRFTAALVVAAPALSKARAVSA